MALSWQAHLLNSVFRLLAKFGKKKTNVLAYRKELEVFDSKLFRANPTLNRKIESSAPVPYVKFSGGRGDGQAVSPGEKIILYLHGGGFVGGVPNAQGNWMDNWCEALGVSAVMPEYRLAPESPYPAALDDCFAMYGWLLDSGVQSTDIVIAGDSAGGCLTLATMHRIKQAGLPNPACLVAVSPATDLTMSGKSVVENAHRDLMFKLTDLFTLRNAYASEEVLVETGVSPLFGDFTNWPPLCLHASESEILRDDSTRIAERAGGAGVDVELKLWAGMPHVFQVFHLLPEARRSNAEMMSFISRHTGWQLSN